MPVQSSLLCECNAWAKASHQQSKLSNICTISDEVTVSRRLACLRICAVLQDLESSEDLAQKLNALFPEDQIYRCALSSTDIYAALCNLHHSSSSHTHAWLPWRPASLKKEEET